MVAHSPHRYSRQPAPGFSKGLKIVGGIGAVIKIDVRGDRLDHRPDRFAQQRNRLEDSQLVEIPRIKVATIGLEQARSWSSARPKLADAFARSKSGCPAPAYSQSTSQSRAPSSIRLAASKSLWHNAGRNGAIRRDNCRASSSKPPRSAGTVACSRTAVRA